MATYMSSVAGGWKPLRGMKAATFPCRRGPSPPVSDADARFFCSSFSEDVRALEMSLGQSPVVSLRWSADAMQVLKKMQVGLLALFRRSDLPVSVRSKEGWFDQYMEDTAVLLNLCNHLKSAAAATSRYRMVVDLAIQKLQNGSTPEFGNLETEHEKFLQVSNVMKAPPSEDATASPSEPIRCDRSAAGVAMLAANYATVAISMILVSAFTAPVGVDVGNDRVARDFPEVGALAAALASLVGSYRESTCGGGLGVALAEHRLVRESVGDLRTQLEKGRTEGGEELGQSVWLLRQRSMGLKEGIDLFDVAVDEVFDEMIRGRNELLATFRDEALA